MKKKFVSKFHEGDFGMIITTIILSLFGLIMVFSASYYTGLSKYGDPVYFLKDDLKWMILGWVAFLVCSFIDYHFLKWLAIPAIFIGFVLLGLIWTPLGITINNATRWLDFKLFTVMPGEVIKTCIILFFAWLYSTKMDLKDKKFVNALPGLGITGLAFILVFKQPNFSTAGIVALIGIGVMFLAGLSISWIVFGGAAAVAGVGALVFMKGGYMLERITGFWDPFADSLGKGYQVAQGLLAFGSGGVTGLGLGKSVQKALYLPEPMNDFILPIIGEELGFIGVTALIAVFIVLVWRIFTVSIHAKDKFGMLLAGGVAMHLAFQVIINIAVVTASFPPTGVVLPLISLGGTATILMMAELGIAYNVSKQTRVTL